MKECQILFSADMIRAIMSGRKTQTRRIVKHAFADSAKRVAGPYSDGAFDFIFDDDTGGLVTCPYGKPGDRLAAQCALAESDDVDSLSRLESDIALEILSVRVERLNSISQGDVFAEGIDPASLDPASLDPLPIGWGNSLGNWAYGLPIGSFFSLWQSIYGPGSWAKNPWVWVIEFRRVLPNKTPIQGAFP